MFLTKLTSTFVQIKACTIIDFFISNCLSCYILEASCATVKVIGVNWSFGCFNSSSRAIILYMFIVIIIIRKLTRLIVVTNFNLFRRILSVDSGFYSNKSHCVYAFGCSWVSVSTLERDNSRDKFTWGRNGAHSDIQIQETPECKCTL